MTDGDPTNDPTRPSATAPGERRLARPPSERYRAAEAAATARRAPTPRSVSVARGLAYAAIAEVVTAAVITVLGGILTVTAGLLVVTGVSGWVTAWAVKAGAGSTIPAARRAVLAGALALGGVLLGGLGLWLYARTEGGVLPLVDYLGEVFGPILPLGAVLAGLTAWVTAR